MPNKTRPDHQSIVSALAITGLHCPRDSFNLDLKKKEENP
jgi:hypothetical protein